MGRISRSRQSRKGLSLSTPSPTSLSTSHSLENEQFLLTQGIHPDAGARHDESPALPAAVAHGRVDIVELLASHGADLNRANPSGNLRFESVIHIAAANGDSDMIKLLAEYGADVGSENLMGMYVGTPLHLAVLHSHVCAVQTLLALQVPVDGLDSSCSTPLDVAEMVASEDVDTEEWWEEILEIGKMLVNAGAPCRYTEEGLRELGDRPDEKNSLRFQRIMIAARD